MNYLSVEQISKRFGERLIFENLTFGINKGQKVALVAKNGTGKSTLFNMLAGSDTADTGRIVFNNDIRIGFLAQDHGLDEHKSILENLFDAKNPMTAAIAQYELALENGDEDALQKASDAMDAQNAWDYESQAQIILGKLDLHDLKRNCLNLSGGEKRRIALAKVLITAPDFLLLDEPTNHLDLEMIEWLEEYLEKTNMTIFMITHDRYFLEVICDEILEMDDNQLYRYKGNFSYFLEKKAEREENEIAVREKARNLMRRELKWIRTQPKARTTKSKYRQDQFKDVKKAATKRLEEDELKLEVNIQRLGGKIVEFHRVRMSYPDKTILEGFDYIFKRRERVGIAGKNGAGKTTLLDLLTHKTDPEGGKIVVGETVSFGYYTQKGMNFKDGQRVIEAVREIADVIPLTRGKTLSAAQMLERFLFPRSMHFNQISTLSGGEKKRLHLLTILMKNPNFLILDEPTNDLDIFALAALEDYLLQFPGCLMVVSHDRYFMDKLVDHILVLDGTGEVKDIVGNYSDWRELQKKEKRKTQNEKVKKAPADKVEKKDQPKTKLSFKEKYELEQLDKEIPELESKKSALEEKLSSGITDHEEIMKLSEQLGKVVKDLDQKSERWLELSEFA